MITHNNLKGITVGAIVTVVLLGAFYLLVSYQRFFPGLDSYNWHQPPDALHRSIDDFQKIRHGCEWHVRDPALIQTGRFLNNTQHVATRYCESVVWRILNTGPLISTGGMMPFKNGYYHDAFRFHPDVSRIFLTGSYTSVIREDEEVISSDDFHYHHLFIFHGDLPSEQPNTPLRSSGDPLLTLEWMLKNADLLINPNPLVFTGSDHSCKLSEGGEDCLMFEYPSGFGQEIFHNDTTTWIVVDMRPVTSMNLSFHVEAAVRLSMSRPTRGLLMFSSFINGWWTPAEWDDSFGRTPEFYGAWDDPWPIEGGGVLLRGSLTHVYWSVTRASCSGDLVYTHIHGHRIAELRHWLFAGIPNDVGLNVPPYTMAKPWLPVQLTDGNLTTFEAYMYRHLRASVSTLICTSTPVRDAAVHRSYIASIDREDTTICKSWHFEHGDFKTQVCAARIPEGYPRQEEYMSMHCTVNQLWLVSEGSDLDYSEWGTRFPDQRQVPQRILVKHAPLLHNLGGLM